MWIKDEIIIVRLLSRYENVLWHIKVGDRCSDCKEIVVLKIKSEYVQVNWWVIKGVKVISPGVNYIEVTKKQKEKGITKVKNVDTIESKTIIIVKCN